MTMMSTATRAATGIEGLDDILNGGLKPHRVYLLEGSPGTGKTTISLQFLMEGAQLVGGDGFVVDHGDDAVDLQRLRAWRLGMGQRDGEAGEQAEQQNAKFHGVSKGDSEFCWLIRP